MGPNTWVNRILSDGRGKSKKEGLTLKNIYFGGPPWFRGRLRPSFQENMRTFAAILSQTVIMSFFKDVSNIID